MTRAARLVPLLVALLAAPATARAGDDLPFTDFLFPGKSAVRVVGGYLRSADAWESDVGGGLFLEASGGAFLPGTLYGTLFGFEGRVQLGYPLTPNMPLLALEASVAVAPVWVRVGPVVLRLSGSAGLGVGGPASLHTLLGARVQLFGDAFGLGVHAQTVPGASNDRFKGETRLEASLSIGPVELGARWLGGTWAYQADDKPTPSAPFQELRERSALGGFVGARF